MRRILLVATTAICLLAAGRCLARPAANAYFMSQFPADAPPRIRRFNEDCGPTCLAMALRRWGRLPADIQPHHLNREKLIVEARVAMTGRRNHRQPTNERQLAAGARKFGLQAQILDHLAAHRFAALNQALRQGRLVVADGNPEAPGAYGRRLSKAAYWHNNTGHFVLIAGRTARGMYLVNDPLSRQGTLRVRPGGLRGFLRARGEGGGVAIWR